MKTSIIAFIICFVSFSYNSFCQYDIIVEPYLIGGNCYGNIMVEVNGTSGPFEIQLFYAETDLQVGTRSYSDIKSGTELNIEGIYKDNYYIKISDRFGCSYVEEVLGFDCGCILKINSIPNQVKSPSGCNLNNGKIEHDFSKPPFNFITGAQGSLNFSLNAMYDGASLLFDNLDAGMYTLIVTDEVGCTDEIIIDLISEGSDLQILGVGITNTCEYQNNGSISIYPYSSSNTDLFASWSNGGIGYYQSDLSAGEYCVTVNDTKTNCSINSCFSVQSINDNGPITDLSLVYASASCNSGNNGFAQLLTSGGTPPFDYNWDNDEFNNNNISAYLIPGNNCVTVTDICGNSEFLCFDIENCELNIFPILSHPSSETSSDGSISLNLDNNCSVDILWSNGSNSQILSDLSSGTYSVTISNESCVYVETFILKTDCEPIASIPILLTDFEPPVFGELGYYNFDFSELEIPFSVKFQDSEGSILYSKYFNSTLDDFTIEIISNANVNEVYTLMISDDCGVVNSLQYSFDCSNLNYYFGWQFSCNQCVSDDCELINSFSTSNPVTSDYIEITWHFYERIGSTYSDEVLLAEGQTINGQYFGPMEIEIPGSGRLYTGFRNFSTGCQAYFYDSFSEEIESCNLLAGNVDFYNYTVVTGVSHSISCGENVIQNFSRDYFEYFPIDNDSPCKSGGFLIIDSDCVSEVYNVPSSNTHEYIELGDGCFACIFDNQIFTEISTQFPVYVENCIDEIGVTVVIDIESELPDDPNTGNDHDISECTSGPWFFIWKDNCLYDVYCLESGVYLDTWAIPGPICSYIRSDGTCINILNCSFEGNCDAIVLDSDPECDDNSLFCDNVINEIDCPLIDFSIIEDFNSPNGCHSEFEANSFNNSNLVYFNKNFRSTFEPIVILGSISGNDNEPGYPILLDIDSVSFSYKIQEWLYQDGVHDKESLSYIYGRPGKSEISGLLAEFGSINGVNHEWKTVTFNNPYSTTPVVFCSQSSINDPTPALIQIKNVTSESFQIRLREEQASSNQQHSYEKINYFASEVGQGLIGNKQVIVGLTDNVVGDSPYTLSFNSQFALSPILIAHTQTTNSNDVGILRHLSLSENSVQFWVDEETSFDSETYHEYEAVGYLLIENDSDCIEDCDCQLVSANASSCGIQYEIEGKNCKDFKLVCTNLSGFYFENNLLVEGFHQIDDIIENETYTVALVSEGNYCDEQIIEEILINSCVPPSQVCSVINDNASGNNNWQEQFISDGDGYLRILFDSYTIPDQIIINLNGIEVSNSGHFSRSGSQQIIDQLWSDCNVIRGLGYDFVDTITLNVNDIIEVFIIADNCNYGNTLWNLNVECFGPNELVASKASKPDIITRGNKENLIQYTDFKLYPNPASDVLNIDLPNLNQPVSIYFYDISGNYINSIIDVTENKVSCSLNNFPIGLYFVRIVGDNFKFNFKMVKS